MSTLARLFSLHPHVAVQLADSSFFHVLDNQVVGSHTGADGTCWTWLVNGGSRVVARPGDLLDWVEEPLPEGGVPFTAVWAGTLPGHLRHTGREIEDHEAVQAYIRDRIAQGSTGLF